MFTSANTEGYTADELRDANAAMEHFDAAHPNADEQERKTEQERILHAIDDGLEP